MEIFILWRVTAYSTAEGGFPKKVKVAKRSASWINSYDKEFVSAHKQLPTLPNSTKYETYEVESVILN